MGGINKVSAMATRDCRCAVHDVTTPGVLTRRNGLGIAIMLVLGAAKDFRGNAGGVSAVARPFYSLPVFSNRHDFVDSRMHSSNPSLYPIRKLQNHHLR
jgi:hypothetical protein